MNLPPPEDPSPHPTLDRSKRFVEDRWLRRHGFRIYSRPKSGDAIWSRGGQLYFHVEALALANLDLKSVER